MPRGSPWPIRISPLPGRRSVARCRIGILAEPSSDRTGPYLNERFRRQPTMHVTQRHDEAALFGRYHLAAYDEMFDSRERPRPHYAPLYERLIELGPDELERRHKVADLTMRQQGITFTVYGREQGVERIIPFDPIPRLIAAGRVGPASSAGSSSGSGRSTCSSTTSITSG